MFGLVCLSLFLLEIGTNAFAGPSCDPSRFSEIATTAEYSNLVLRARNGILLNAGGSPIDLSRLKLKQVRVYAKAFEILDDKLSDTHRLILYRWFLGTDETTGLPLGESFNREELKEILKGSSGDLGQMIEFVRNGFNRAVDEIQGKNEKGIRTIFGVFGQKVDGKVVVDFPLTLREALRSVRKIKDKPAVNFSELSPKRKRLELIRQYKLIVRRGVQSDLHSLGQFPRKLWPLLGFNFSGQTLANRIRTVFADEAKAANLTLDEYMQHLTGLTKKSDPTIRFAPYAPTTIVVGDLTDGQLALLSRNSRGYTFMQPREKFRDLIRQFKYLEAHDLPIDADAARKWSQGHVPQGVFTPDHKSYVNIDSLFRRVCQYMDCSPNRECFDRFISEYSDNWE